MTTLFKVSAATGKTNVWWMSIDGNAMTSHSGLLNGKIKTSTTYAEGKNIGKANETSDDEQAILEVAAKYEQQQANKHYRPTQEEAHFLILDCKIPRKVKNYKDDEGGMSDTLLTSIKVNGSRACIQEGDFYSKAGKLEQVKVAHIRGAITKLHNAGYGNFDSEVYCHGMSLQRIRAAWTKPLRTEKDRLKKIEESGYDPVADALKLQLHVFDIVDKTTRAKHRQLLLRNFKQKVSELGLDHIVKVIFAVETHSKLERAVLRDIEVAKGYEGLVHQELFDMIVADIRTSTTQKDKPRRDSEAFVVGVEICKNGDGKLLLKACDELGKVTFKAMMKVKRRDGGKYPRDFNTMEKLVGTWITFSYEELSDKGIPTKPVGEEMRLCDSTGSPLE